MRVGFVGVGPHATNLASAFQAEGAEIVGYARATKEPTKQWLGRRMSLDRMAIELDAVVIAAPPEVTLRAALYCSRVGVPVLATKPLMLEEPITLRDVFFVDYWRLWDVRYLAFKQVVQASAIEQIDVHFCGNGPFRAFPGALDYGPHALAYLHDLVDGDLEVRIRSCIDEQPGDRVTAAGQIGRTNFTLQTGNGFPASMRKLRVALKNGRTHTFLEDTASAPKDRYAPMVRAFMTDVRNGTIRSKTMLMSVAIWRTLKQLVRLTVPAERVLD